MTGHSELQSDCPLGACIERFNTPLGNIVAGTILGIGLIGAGIYGLVKIAQEIYVAGGKLPFYADKGMCWSASGLLSVLAIGAVVVGVFLVRQNWELRSHSSALFEGGVGYRLGNVDEEISWEQIASIRENILHQRPPLLKWPARLLLPKLKYYGYIVTSKDGNVYGFDRHSINDV